MHLLCQQPFSGQTKIGRACLVAGQALPGVLRRLSLGLWLLSLCGAAWAQGQPLDICRANRQQAFSRAVPPGNYSGIASMGGDDYAVVDDKSATDGFHVFHLQIDSLTGRLLQVTDKGFRSSGLPNRDGEGIAFIPERQTVMVVGEGDHTVREYRPDGTLTGLARRLTTGAPNRSYESLTYDAVGQVLWTVTEGALPADGADAEGHQRLRLQAFDSQLLPLRQHAYLSDAPLYAGSGQFHVWGVSDLLALGDGSLLVLEREIYVPKARLRATVGCRLYQVWPSEASEVTSEQPLSVDAPFLSKRLVYEWKTRLTLTGRSYANYEGLCLGPRLADGRQVLILVADSQNRYRGVLRDWFRMLVVCP